MKTPHDDWDRLVAAARRAPAGDLRPVEAPVGFATRVVAQAFARTGEASLLGLLDRFSWRALAVAFGLAVASVGLNFASARQVFLPDTLADQDPVTVVLDLS